MHLAWILLAFFLAGWVAIKLARATPINFGILASLQDVPGMAMPEAAMNENHLVSAWKN